MPTKVNTWIIIRFAFVMLSDVLNVELPIETHSPALQQHIKMFRCPSPSQWWYMVLLYHFDLVSQSIAASFCFIIEVHHCIEIQAELMKVALIPSRLSFLIPLFFMLFWCQGCRWSIIFLLVHKGNIEIPLLPSQPQSLSLNHSDCSRRTLWFYLNL